MTSRLLVRSNHSISGERNYRAVLTNVQIVELRRRYAAGADSGRLAQEFGLSRGAVTQIALGRRYREAGGPITSRKPRACDDWTAMWIRVLAPDFTNQELGIEFALSADMVKRIRYGLSYGWLSDVIP